jgi:DnaJ-class molecular chaperone
LLAKQHHPDVNPGSAEASTRTQAINAAYAMLSEPERRRAYDHELAAKKKPAARTAKIKQNISQDVHLRIQDFLRGTSLEVRVQDPANPAGPETYPLNIQAETPPGTRFRVPRISSNEGGFILVRVRARPDFRFKVRGSDLRCDLRISSQRATQGGTEMVAGANSTKLRLQIPPRVASGEIIRIPGEGLPKPRGGRGDLLVRILYRPEVRISRARDR